MRGVDLAAVCDADFTAIEAAFATHSVLVFPDQHLNREQHKALGRRFGALHVHPGKRVGLLRGDPEIFTVKVRPDSTHANGESWHSDLSCEPVPPAASLLYVTEVPASGGGDTLFASMTAAWETLSEPMRRLLDGLHAVHDGRIDLKAYDVELPPGTEYPRATHPVVCRHPVTGQPYVFVNPSFTSHIVELPRWESDWLLHGLYRLVATSPRLQCRVRWRPNTLTLWDNRSAQHHAVRDYPGESRYGERVTIAGQAPPPAYRIA